MRFPILKLLRYSVSQIDAIPIHEFLQYNIDRRMPEQQASAAPTHHPPRNTSIITHTSLHPISLTFPSPLSPSIPPLSPRPPPRLAPPSTLPTRSANTPRTEGPSRVAEGFAQSGSTHRGESSVRSRRRDSSRQNPRQSSRQSRRQRSRCRSRRASRLPRLRRGLRTMPSRLAEETAKRQAEVAAASSA